MQRRLVPLVASLTVLINGAPALSQCCIPTAKVESGSFASSFFKEDFFSVLERAKKEHKPIVVALSPNSQRLVDTLSSEINRRALEPFLKTSIPWTRKETEKLPLTNEQKEIMRSYIECGGHLGWPVVLFLNEKGVSVGVGAYLSAEQFPFDCITVYKTLNIPVPPYLEKAAKTAVEKIESNRAASDGLTDFWSGGYPEVIAMANKENKPIFVALAPVDPSFARKTLSDPRVRQALSKFLKTRVGIHEDQKELEKALLQGSVGETVYPPVLPERHMGRCTLGWPSWYFLDSKAKLVHHFNGSPEIESFLEHCQKASEKISEKSN